MVVQSGVGRVEHLKTGLTGPQAEIGVIERNGQILLVQPTNDVEYGTVDDSTGKRYRADIANDVRQVKETGVVSRQPLEDMHRTTIRTEHHTGMLDRVVRVQEFSADDPDFRSLGKL